MAALELYVNKTTIKAIKLLIDVLFKERGCAIVAYRLKALPLNAISKQSIMEENNITVDKAVQTIKGAILRAQAQASQSSNAIQLSLYYGIGRYVSINLQQAHWGAKTLDTISERLQRELPGLRGFSSGNLKKMRIFYEEWQCLSIGSPMANQLQQFENKIEEGVEIGEKYA